VSGWSSKEYLELCNELHKGGLALEFKAGQRIGRGFADLGVEEFILTTPEKMVSLFTGQSSILQDEHKKFFFWIPSCDELVDELLKRKIVIETIGFPNAREWKVNTAGQNISADGREINLALGRVLLLAISREKE
jgi:hypothetical protein